jgi:hypothetical protein
MLQPEPAVSVPPLPVAIPVKPPTEPRPRRRRRPRLEEEHDEEKSSRFWFPSELIHGLDNFFALVLVAVAFWVLLGVIGLFVTPVAFLLVILGIILAAGGQIWFLIVAFQEDIVTGILVLLVPFYALFFLISNLEIAGRPFVVNLVGALMLVTGIAIIMRAAGAG